MLALRYLPCKEKDFDVSADACLQFSLGFFEARQGGSLFLCAELLLIDGIIRTDACDLLHKNI